MRVKFARDFNLIAMLLVGMLYYESCQEPELHFDNYKSEIVVDGWIEQDKSAMVFLTLSTPYFGEVDSTSLRKYVITRAKVTLISDTEEEVLTLRPNNDYFPPYVYVSTDIKGKVNEKYGLRVDYNGKTVTAITSIPEPVELNDIYFKLKESDDSLGLIWYEFADNEISKDYYRTFTKIVGEESKYIPTYYPNFDDIYFNGQTVVSSLQKGNKSTLEKTDEFYFKLGDTVSVKICTIDKASFDFWSTFYKETYNAGNPFAATNAKVKSNVENGLGVWCGYGASYYYVIAK